MWHKRIQNAILYYLNWCSDVLWSMKIYLKGWTIVLTLLGVSYITANLYCICVSSCFMFAQADAVQIGGKFWKLCIVHTWWISKHYLPTLKSEQWWAHRMYFTRAAGHKQYFLRNCYPRYWKRLLNIASYWEEEGYLKSIYPCFVVLFLEINKKHIFLKLT